MTRPDHRAPTWRLRALLAGICAALVPLLAPAVSRADPFSSCPAGPSQIACENALPGDSPGDWQVSGDGDPTIQGFTASMSVNAGDTINFKIKTPASSYHIDILRLGYYQGNGARMIAAGLKPTASLPQTQPACLTDSSTGLIDCGNWGVSASWSVPSDAISGLYIAHLVRDDTGGDSQIPFVVRNDAGHSAIVFQTSDASWEAYNNYGGNNLYSCTVACPPGNPLAYKGAFKVSYNRPLSFTIDGGAANPYYAEYPMIRFLEANGYDVSYISESDSNSRGSLLLNHKLFLTSGHDEYWSGPQRANVTAARDAGVSLAFFTGNEMFWKTRWEPSIDASATPDRTLVTYKETHFTGPTDPQDPPTWTGAWADPRFSPPADGGLPANALTGQEFAVNSGSAAITVPGNYAKLRIWRNTAAANLTPSQSLKLAPETLGYEWDVDADNGFRPGGTFDLSSTTVSGLEVFTDYGSTVKENGTATHNLTLYRAPSGALVFGAGTVQWAWGLDSANPGQDVPDKNMQQATVNLFADMGVQPTTLLSGLSPASASLDTTPPVSTITAPSSGANLQDASQVTISGTASDSGGGVVAGVEVSTDGGQSWHPATMGGAAAQSVSWSYKWIARGAPSTTIESRAVDDSGNIETPSAGVSVNLACPCSIWGTTITPPTPDSGDAQAVEVGVKFRSDTFGQLSGVRFYKAAANTGTHVGSVWDSSGNLLASATFTNETASGWQTVTFSSPINIMPNTTYVAGYFAPVGHYAVSASYFYPSPAPNPLGGATYDSAPLHAVPNNSSGNGVFAYGSSSRFPTDSFNASNYWVDALFSPSPAPGQVTNVSATAGKAGAVLTWSAPTSGGPVTSYTITPYVGSTPQQATTITGSSPGSAPPTTTRISKLDAGTSYTFTVVASNPNGSGPPSSSSNAVTPTPLTTPSAPANVSATTATSSAIVTWSTPTDNGGIPITGYSVTPYIGANAQTPLQVSDPAATSAIFTGLTNGVAYTFTVIANNQLGGSAPSAPTAAVTPYDTIFDFAIPKTPDSGDAGGVNLGVEFKADVAGWITGIRYYRSQANTGTHVGSLWDANGNLLATATFTSETAAGWQQVTFPTPVVVSVGKTYVASYYTPTGHYAWASNGFSSSVDNAPLHALANATSPNGLFAYANGNAFPNGSFLASNYYVDAMFLPMPLPGQVTGVSATAGQGTASVTWSAPSGGGPVATYTVTPFIGSTAQPSATVSASTPSASLENLTGNTTYTFQVTANNAAGPGPASAPSNAVVPTLPAPPSAPSNVIATPATSSAVVGWSAPTSDGGSSITGYTITPYIGSAAQNPVQVPGASAISAKVSGLTNGATYTFQVAANNGAGAGTSSSPSSPVTPDNTVFDFSTPTTLDSGDTSSVDLGVKFTADVAGQVTGIRFYKAAGNTGTHVGALWDSGGHLLASATFSNETASGWQQVTFSSPVSLVPHATYVASYYAPQGHYSLVANGFSSAVDNPPLHGVANSTSPNGVFTYAHGRAFPNESFNASDYYVDVLFNPTPNATAPSPPQNVTASPARTSALVSWAAPTNDGGSPLTGYTVIPYVGSTAQAPVQVSDTTATSVDVTGLTNGTTYTFTVTANNGVGASSESPASAQVVPEDTLFDFATPSVADAGDTTPVELGVKFTSDVNGTITGIRFYKAASNTGTHVGSLWDSSGNLLASAVFTNETASGWQQVTFANALPVTAGTTYVAGYFSPNGHYSAAAGAFASAVDSPPLHAVANPISPNGVFTYTTSSAFPTSAFGASNYWVDVEFAPS